MRTLEQQLSGKCRHFNGTANAACDAGIDYQIVRDVSKKGTRQQYPCFVEGECLKCESRDFLTPEEVSSQVDEIIQQLVKSLAAMAAAKEDAASKGIKKGKGGQSECKCPSCETGSIKYSVAEINGHLWARCTTPDCCAWIE